MAWTTPVIDRELHDVLAKTKKGYCNSSDLNRIEENCAELASLFGVEIQTKSWSRTDFPSASQMRRILANIDYLREIYYTLSSTPITPENPFNTWQKFNDAEKILLDLHELYLKNQQAFIFAGEAYAGDKIGVI